MKKRRVVAISLAALAVCLLLAIYLPRKIPPFEGEVLCISYIYVRVENGQVRQEPHNFQFERGSAAYQAVNDSLQDFRYHLLLRSFFYNGRMNMSSAAVTMDLFDGVMDMTLINRADSNLVLNDRLGQFEYRESHESYALCERIIAICEEQEKGQQR